MSTASNGNSITSVRISDIALQADFQVRNKLDSGIIKRYAMAYKQGQDLPPLKVAKIGKALVLVDGWHRMGALKRNELAFVEVEIISCRSERDAMWLAAKANLQHGLPLKARELRPVFRAYIRSRQHCPSKGCLKSYRDIASDLGGIVSHATIRNWMRRDFPSIFRRMGDHEELPHGKGGIEDVKITTMKDTTIEHLGMAFAAFRGVESAEDRQELAQEVERMLLEMNKEDVQEPPTWDEEDY